MTNARKVSGGSTLSVPGVAMATYSLHRDDVDDRHVGIIVTKEWQPRDHPAITAEYPYHVSFATERPIDLNRSVIVFEGDE